MKKIIVMIVLLAVTATLLGQQSNPPSTSIKQDYLKKSKSQKKTGWLMLTGGSTLLITSFLIPKGESSLYNSTTNVGNLFSFTGPPETVYKNTTILLSLTLSTITSGQQLDEAFPRLTNRGYLLKNKKLLHG